MTSLSRPAAATAARPHRRWLMLLAVAGAVLVHRPVEVAMRTWHLIGPVYHAIPARGTPRDMAVVFLSGDAGFNRGSGPEIAGRLARDGYPVLGVDSLNYFATKRTPEDDARLVAVAAAQALRWTGAHRFAVVGESFGADMAPTAVERLPAPLRARLAMVALVVPTRTVDFHISLGEWMGWTKPDADAATVARRIGPVPLLCIRGLRETQSLCPLLAMPDVTQSVLSGDHYLDHDYDRTAAVLEAGFARAMPAPASGAPRATNARPMPGISPSSGDAAPAAPRSGPR